MKAKEAFDIANNEFFKIRGLHKIYKTIRSFAEKGQTSCTIETLTNWELGKLKEDQYTVKLEYGEYTISWGYFDLKTN